MLDVAAVVAVAVVALHVCNGWCTMALIVAAATAVDDFALT